MSGFGSVSDFSCTECGSPAIMLPEKLAETSTICCSGCGHEIGTWGAFKSRTKQMIMAEIARGAVDPRCAGTDLALEL